MANFLKQIKYLPVAAGLIIGTSALVSTPAFAALRGIAVYNGGGTSNTTESGWTDNHLLGQSFLNPLQTPGIGKITGIELTNFKFGNAGGNQGSIVRVDLYEGAPAVAINVDMGSGYRTTVITSDPATRRAQIERVYIPGWQTTRWLANMCGLDTEGSESYGMRWLRINNPQKPCPKTYDSDNNGIPDGDSDIVGTSDGSVKFWTVFPWGTAYSQSNGWQSDSTLEVPFPSNKVNPGSTYYVAIQQYYLNSGDYLADAKYNCLTSPGFTTLGSGEVCDQTKVLVAPLTNDNRWPSGEAYFNSYYYSGGRDAATLTIKGIFYPVASVTGNQTGFVGQAMTFTGSAVSDAIARLTQGEIYVVQNDGTTPAKDWGCPSGSIAGDPNTGVWCLISTTTLSTNGPENFPGTWTPPAGAAGKTFRVVVNAYDNEGMKCTGNPWTSFPNPSWFDCGNADSLQVTIQSLPYLSTMNIGPNTSDNPPAQNLGPARTSGLRSDDPNLPGKGNNYKNSVTITQNVINADSSNTKLVGVAFTQASSTIIGGLYELTYSTYQNNGFVLIYAPPGRSGTDYYYDGTWIVQQKTFYGEATGRFYVYKNGSWGSRGFTPGGNDACGANNTPCVNSTALTVNIIEANVLDILPNPKFRVRLYQPLGSRTWGTYGYLMDIADNKSVRYESSP